MKGELAFLLPSAELTEGPKGRAEGTSEDSWQALKPCKKMRTGSGQIRPDFTPAG